MKFTIRALLLLTAIIAFALAALFAFPPAAAAICLFLLNAILPAGVLAGAVYGDGSLRAFCIGMLLPLGFFSGFVLWQSMLIGSTTGMSDLAAVAESDDLVAAVAEFALFWKAATIVLWPIACVCGAMSSLVRWLLLPKPQTPAAK